MNNAWDDYRRSIFPHGQRRPGGVLGLAITLATTGICLITLYWGFVISPGPYVVCFLHLTVLIPIIFLLYPARGADDFTSHMPTAMDWLLALVSFLVLGWGLLNAERYETRIPYSGAIKPIDMIAGIVAVLMIFEATRRTVGLVIVIVGFVFIAYALTGPHWPSVFAHRGSTVVDLVESIYMLQTGMVNFIVVIAATFVFTFITFGVFLQVSGGIRIFTDLAMGLAGHRRGGPAKVAILSSAMMGTLSGSTISNVVTTGALTIPMMKKSGFKPHEAAAIETCASVGGALTPPMMGAGVMIMAEFTNIPLITLLSYSVLPAILFYVSLYCYVDLKSRKAGMQGLPRDELPRVLEVLKRDGHIFVPIVVLVVLLLIEYTPYLASSACVVASLLISFVRSSTRIGPKKLLVALEGASRATMAITPIATCAAIIYAVIAITGLLVKVTSVILALSGGSILLAVIFIALMSYVLGMGLPVSAAYVLIAVLGAPALADLGLPIIAAHMIIFWFSQDSTITPPICMTAIVAARMAGAPPMKTGFQSMLMGKALYIVPLVFAFGNLLDDSIPEIIFDFVVMCAFFLLMPRVTEGYHTRHLALHERALFIVAGGLMFWSAMGPMSAGIYYAIGGIVLSLLGHRAVVSRPQVESEVGS